ncbi:MAG: FHA domain-containing protein [Verrucomicrobiia bacterium]|jgi:pSer/pThr/pTyr-binding forkhead associated (FHA) protein
MPKLHILSPSSLATTIELTDKLITIGRNEDNAICIPDTNVSSMHGMLVRDGDTYQLHDFKSTNGTFVNGEQIIAVKLPDGASIRLGPVELRYESGLAKVSPLEAALADQQVFLTPTRGSGNRERAGMSKRMKPEYSAGALGAGPVTIQPSFTAKPIPPASSDTSE